MFASPMLRTLGSPRYFRSCGTEPTLANGKMRFRSPIRVRPSMIAFAPTHVSAPIRTSGPTTANGPMRTPSASSARGETTAVGCTCGPAGTPRPNSTSATTASASATMPRNRQSGPPASALTSSRSESPGTTGRRKRARCTPRRTTGPASGTTAAPSCASASHSRTPGTTGRPGKCPAKYGSLALTSLVATPRTPGSTSRIRSSKRYGKLASSSRDRCQAVWIRRYSLGDGSEGSGSVGGVAAPPGFAGAGTLPLFWIFTMASVMSSALSA
jgi:hypothetical protein